MSSAQLPVPVTVTLFKAVGQDVPTLVVNVADEIPREAAEPGWEEKSYARFREQARVLCLALIASLPGGTVDQLLIELLTRRASHFVVRHGKD